MATETIPYLLKRLEKLVAQINDEVPTNSNQPSSVKLGDDFQVLKRACMDQTNTVRESIAARDQTEKKGQGSTVEGIAASAKVRRELNELAVVAERLHNAHQQMVQHDKQTNSDQGREVEELLRNVEACLEQERRRWGAAQAASSPAKAGSGQVAKLGGSWKPKMPKAAASGAAGAAGAAASGGDIRREELEEGLIQAQERDAAMEGSLDAILSGLGRLKGVAQDMEEEALVQNLMIDEIHDRALRAEGDLRNLNRRMEVVLRNAGGPGRVIANICLFLLLLALALYVYQTVLQHRIPADSASPNASRA
mmetsp:Transcript_111121/g.166399  ORF Transcript_111121/g.166399 Transcript_111121/m.166399 type:complete len:309 (+) Transcript_111121:341-1267(+)